MSPTDHYLLFGVTISGNCYKPKLLMTQLGLPFRWIEIDMMQGETRSPDFLAKNPNGKVPLLQLPSGEYLSESNAMLCYLADGTSLLPNDRLTRARVMEWLFWEQYSHEPVIAVARFIALMLPPDHPRRGELPALRERSTQVLQVMASRLGDKPFLTGDQYTIADIALYAYTHVAGDAGISLDGHPNLQHWLGRVEQTPHFIPMLPKA